MTCKHHWTLNGSDKTGVNIDNFLQNTINFDKDIKDKSFVWEWIKYMYEIKKFCVKFGTKRKKQVNIETGNLLKSLDKFEAKLGTEPNINECEQIKK